MSSDNLQLLRQKLLLSYIEADGTQYMTLITMDGCYLVDRNLTFWWVQTRFPCKPTSEAHIGYKICSKDSVCCLEPQCYVSFDLVISELYVGFNRWDSPLHASWWRDDNWYSVGLSELRSRNIDIWYMICWQSIKSLLQRYAHTKFSTALHAIMGVILHLPSFSFLLWIYFLLDNLLWCMLLALSCGNTWLCWALRTFINITIRILKD